MLNGIWVVMVVAAVVFGAVSGNLDAVTEASVDAAKDAVTLALGLVGVMAFWLGLMKVLQQGGLLRALAAALRPVMRRLFPDVPADHPAMSMMVLNMTSNMLGLGNAATPFGLKAMMELDTLNRNKGTATNAMALFLAVNTSNIAILPTGMIALRASLGSDEAGAIVLPTILATGASTVVAILTAKLLSRLEVFAMPTVADAATQPGDRPVADVPDTSEAEALISKEVEQPPLRTRLFAGTLTVAVIGALAYAFVADVRAHLNGDAEPKMASVGGAIWESLGTVLTEWPLVLLIVGFVLFGVSRGVKVYDAIVEGGKEGFQVALRIIPFLVAILVAVGMLRASGAIDALVGLLQPLSSAIGMPAEALPMALLRPLSGSGAYGVAADIMKTNGPDSLVGYIVSTMQGSTETTFYVLALYYGVVAVRNTRHTLFACLLADACGALIAAWSCAWLLG